MNVFVFEIIKCIHNILETVNEFVNTTWRIADVSGEGKTNINKKKEM